MTSFSPSRSPGSARLQFGWASQRLRSSSLKKPPEPLRRAVADCLSSSSSTHHGNPSTLASEASRTLRDYLAASSTTDLAYTVILEHTLAERERSPAVVARCVALLKRYLLRYVPSEQTLLQIDLFCVNSIAECDSNPNRRVSPWSKTLSQHSGASTSINVFPPSLPASGFSPGALVKSLNYIRSLVVRHISTQSFQSAAFAGASTASKHSLPTLSSFLSKSFNSQLSPVTTNGRESPERKEDSNLSVPNLSVVKRDRREDFDYIPADVLKWRWPGEQQSPFATTESDGVPSLQDVGMHSFVEVGAAALLVGDMEAKMKGRPWKQSGAGDFPDSDQLLHPSTVTTASNIASAHSHLRAITASKRTKSAPHQIWVDSPVSTFRPRARPLFQYRHYSEQQPLRLNPAEVCEVIAAFFSETSLTSANHMTISSRLSNNIGAPSMDDVAGSVLIKLVIDMYVLDSRIAAPLTLSMLEDMLNSPRLTSRIRAFDLILNLGIHAHLLEPMSLDDTPTIEECSQEPYFNNEELGTQEKKITGFCKQNGISAAINKFEYWILSILYEILLLLVQIEEKEESVWASALSCLLYFVCDRGKIWRNRLDGLDIRVIKVLLEISKEHSWAEVVHCKLICMLTNMFYHAPDEPEKDFLNTPVFLVDQVDLLGGIEFLCLEYSRANSREGKRNIFMVLFDYVLHYLNETCLITGASEFSVEEIQPLATMLTLADAPEAFYISVKHGLEGIGEILRRSISTTLSRYPNKDRLNMILEKITGKFDATLGSFTHLDKEFSHMIRITESYKYLNSIEDGVLGTGAGMEAKLSWATLHSLLHSERSAYRQNGYIWLVELLLSEVSEQRGTSIWSNIRNLQRQIGLTGGQDTSDPSEVPLPISITCGLLKSKHNFIRRGFLFVLEKLLMRCKLLLDENELQHSSTGEVEHEHGDSRLEKANALIDLMSSALSLVVQINETDRINILKMCDILFYQLCLRVLPASAMPIGDLMNLGKVFGCTDVNGQINADPSFSQQDISHRGDGFFEEIDSRASCNDFSPLICDTASMAALLLRGWAIVPMQPVARVPAALLYWPLIQLAGAATDDIALGVAVGSKGRGNLPDAASDIRAALLLLLIGKCTADPEAFQEVGGEEFFRELLDDTDSRVAYYSSGFLLKRMMTEDPEKYQRILQSLVFRAQQSNNEKLLENPYLQIRCILQLSNDPGTGL